MVQIGNLAVLLALAASVYAAVAGVVGARARRRDLVASAEHAAHGATGMVVIATVVMLDALVNNDFSIKYVASYTSTTLPLLQDGITICATWS